MVLELTQSSIISEVASDFFLIALAEEFHADPVDVLVIGGASDVHLAIVD